MQKILPISEYQVYLARYYQADAILLMLSWWTTTLIVRSPPLLSTWYGSISAETSNQQKLERAIALGAKVIGINNHDLHGYRLISAEHSLLPRQIPADRIIISESGIYTHNQVQQLKSLMLTDF